VNKKNSMSYIDLLAWITENKSIIEGSRIDNVYKISGIQAYLFKLHSKNTDKFLVVEPGKRIHFTKYDREKSSEGEVRLIRELVKEKIIKSINILGNERIAKIDLIDRKIYIELLPRGLLVITDGNNKVLFSTEYKEFRDRIIRLGIEYLPPPQPAPLTSDEIEKLINKGNLTRILGVPQEILEALNIKINSLEELDGVKNRINDLLNTIRGGKFFNCLIRNVTVLPIKTDECVEYNSYNDALDDYFTQLEKDIVKTEVDKNLEKEKGNLEKTIEELKSQIEEYAKKESEMRQIAETIITNYELIENAIKNSNKKNSVTLKINNISIDIDPKLTVYKNASKYYDLAKEYSEKAKKAGEVLEELRKKLSELQFKIDERKEEIRISLRKKEWYEKYHWGITRNGHIVIAGRDSDQNESIVRKLLDEKDIFLHADIQGAAATVLKANSGQVSEDDILDAAYIAACYSKAWKTGLGSVDVFWVYGNQVSKSPPSGEYLAKGSFMIYGRKNFIKNVKLELAIGIMNQNDEVGLLYGSVYSVETRTKNYVVVGPGDEDLEEISEKILRYLSQSSGVKGLRILKEEIIRQLPGKSRLISRKT